MYSLLRQDINNKAYEVKKLLFDIGYDDYWNDQDYISVSFQAIKQVFLIYLFRIGNPKLIYLLNYMFFTDKG